MTTATPEMARQLWDGMETPSCRRVAAALTQAGHRVSGKTIDGWHKADWRPEPPPHQELASAHVDAAPAAVTPAAGKHRASLPAEPDDGDPDDTAAQRIALAVCELATTSVTVLGAVRRADPVRIVEQPDKVGGLIEKVAKALETAVACVSGLEALRAAAASDVAPGQDAGNVMPAPVALAGTLEAIRRAREGQG